MALASGDWRHRDRTRVPGRWKQSGRDLQHTGRGALATSAQSGCMNTVPQLALEAQPRQATTDVQLALNPSGAGRCAIATILLPHSPPPCRLGIATVIATLICSPTAGGLQSPNTQAAVRNLSAHLHHGHTYRHHNGSDGRDIILQGQHREGSALHIGKQLPSSTSQAGEADTGAGVR